MLYIKYFILCGIIFLWGAGSFAQAEEVKSLQYYQACQQDSDCIVIKGVCGMEAVNKKHQKEREEFNSKNAGFLECMEQVPSSHDEATCVNGSCAIKPSSPKP